MILAEGLVKAIPELMSKVPQIVTSLLNGFVEGFKGILNVGANIVQGLWQGIQNAWSWLVSKVQQFAKSILDGMMSALGIHSPSTLFRDKVGKFIPQGVAVGIDADTDEALKAIRNMNDSIISEMSRAVSFETGSMNATATVRSNNMYNSVIQLNAKFDGSVDINGQKAGRILAPEVAKTIKTGGA